ncbi:MAG: DUF748 domain-containing protein [Steroidobacterales bacterium]
MTEILRRFKWVAIGFAALAGYALAGFLWFPHWVRGEATSFVATELHKKLTLGDVSFNPFTLALDLRQANLGDERQGTIVGLEHLRVNLSWATPFKLSPVFDEILLEKPTTNLLVRKDGSINLGELVPKSSKPETEPQKPISFAITHLALVQGQIGFTDESRPTPFSTRITPINLRLDEFSTRGDSDNRYSIHAVSVDQEIFDWQGTVRLNPVRSTGRISIADLKAETIWSYLRDALSFELPAGSLRLAGDYDFLLGNDAPSLKMKIDEIAITGLALRPPRGADPYITVGALAIKDSAFDLKGRTLIIGTIAVDQANVVGWLEKNGHFNLDELRPPPSAAMPPDAVPVPEPAPAAAPRPWAISMPRISLSASTIAFEDRRMTPAAPMKVEALSASLDGLNNSGQGTFAVQAACDLNGSGHFSTAGTMALDTSALALKIDLKELDLKPLQPYLNEYTDMTLLSGSLSVAGDFSYQPQAISAPIDFHGRVESANLRTIDNQLKEDFIRWRDLAVEGVAFRSSPKRLTVREVRARGPYARVIIAPDSSVNIKTILQPVRRREAVEAPASESAAAQPPAPKEPAMRVEIARVRFENGSANFADLSIRPNFAAGIQTLSGTVVGLSSRADARAVVDLDGKVDEYAPVKIEGDVNYLAAQSYTDLHIAFQNMELTTFTPYSGKFAGYAIRKGKLSVNFKYHVENRKLRADHNVILDQLTLGDKVDSPDATKLPVRLAIALLKDRNGVINLDLPVTGDLDDPQFRLGPLIWKVIINVVTKIVTSPFALLGGLFGAGDEVKYVDFAAGGAVIDAATTERVHNVAKALLERPELEIEIPISFVGSLDREAMINAQFEARVLAEAKIATLPPDRGDYLKVLEKVYRGDFKKKADDITGPILKSAQAKADPAAATEAAITAVSNELKAQLTVADGDLRALGQQRAEAVRALLLEGTGLEPSRVFITAEAPAAIEQGRVRMELALR